MKTTVMAVTVGIVALLFSLILVFLFAQPGYVKHAKAAEQKITQLARIACASGRWVFWTGGNRKQSGPGRSSFRKAVPDWLSNLGAPFPLHDGAISAQPGGTGYATVVWLSGRGGLRLEVGSTNFVESAIDRDLYWIKVSPGIYVFTERN